MYTPKHWMFYWDLSTLVWRSRQKIFWYCRYICLQRRQKLRPFPAYFFPVLSSGSSGGLLQVSDRFHRHDSAFPRHFFSFKGNNSHAFFLSFVIKFWKVFHYYLMAYWGSCLIFIVTESISGRTLYECKQHDFCNGNKECKQVKWNKQWELAQWQALDFKSCHCHRVMLIEYNKATLENDFSDIFIY